MSEEKKARGGHKPLTRDEAIARALRMIGYRFLNIDKAWRPIEYVNDSSGLLGGRDPEAPICADLRFGGRSAGSDCVGLALWATGLDRKQPGYQGSHGEHLNQRALINDANAAQRFVRIVKNPEALPGDLLANDGHIGVIIHPQSDGKHRVVDCSPFHAKGRVDKAAIGTRNSWSTRCVVLRPLYQAGWDD